MKVGTIDKNTGDLWIMPYGNPDVVNLDYWNDRTPLEQMILHYGRRIFEQDTLPNNSADLRIEVAAGWWNNKGESIAHNLGTSGNIDYRGLEFREHQQIIFSNKGNLVITPENGGSYDYITPSLTIEDWFIEGHNTVDVNTWIKWGNTPQDTTTRLQRLESLKSSNLGHTGYKLHGDK